MEAKEKQEIIDTMLLAASALEEAEVRHTTARENALAANNARNVRAREYNTALEGYLKVFPKVIV